MKKLFVYLTWVNKIHMFAFCFVFSNTGIVDWLQGVAFQKLVEDFHHECARPPQKSPMKGAKKHLEHMVNHLRQYLQQRGVVSRMEYQGSSYEGIKVQSSDLEFDCLVILSNSQCINKSNTLCTDGFTRLELKPNFATPLSQFVKDGFLNSYLVKNWFYGEIMKAIEVLSNAQMLTENIICRRHGPAVQIDVYESQHDEILWYSVDMVAGYEITVMGHENKNVYVAKQYNGDLTTWRRSFSIQEKEMMKTLDKDGGCRKQCVRMLKVLRETEAPLKSLQSYFIKTTLLNMLRDKPSKSWARKNLGLRFVDLLRHLCDYLQKGMLPHYFLPKINLVESYSDISLSNMVGRIDHLLNSQEAMTKLLTKHKNACHVKEEAKELLNAPLLGELE